MVLFGRESSVSFELMQRWRHAAFFLLSEAATQRAARMHSMHPFIFHKTSVTQFKDASTVAFRALMRIPRGRGCVR